MVWDAKGDRIRKIVIKPEAAYEVHSCLVDALQSGTGKAAYTQFGLKKMPAAGKTGTAEFQTKDGRINRAWFIGFAPYEKPTVAMAVVIEDGESGSHTAAPVAQQIFAGIFQKNGEAAGGGVDVD